MVAEKNSEYFPTQRKLICVCNQEGLLYAFFWVIPRRLTFICRRFGTLCSSFIGRYVHLPAYEDGTDRVFRNVGTHISHAGESPKRKHTTFSTRRKFEIKKDCVYYAVRPESLDD